MYPSSSREHLRLDPIAKPDHKVFMAVYTEISTTELTDFLKTYDIGEPIALKGIAEGVENSNYLLHTDQGQYILTLYEKRVDPADLPFFIGLMEHLADRGIKCPLPVHDRQGRSLRELANRPAAIISFLEGICLNNPAAKHCSELGRNVAQLHLAGQNYNHHRDNALGITSWRPLFARCRAHADNVQPGLTKLIEDELVALEQNWPKDLPAGVIHADLFPDNVFFIRDAISGFIDFYFACSEAFCFELAVCINAWCFESDGAFNATKARALMTSYNQVRALSKEEIAAMPILCRGTAMRFLLTRLYDWLNQVDGALVKPKDPLDYVHRLRFHQRANSPESYGLS